MNDICSEFMTICYMEIWAIRESFHTVLCLIVLIPAIISLFCVMLKYVLYAYKWTVLQPHTLRHASLSKKNTVESLYSGHHRDHKMVSALWKCPLYRDYFYQSLTWKIQNWAKISVRFIECPLYGVSVLERFHCISLQWRWLWF